MIACLQGDTAELCLALDPATGDVLGKVPTRPQPAPPDVDPSLYEPPFATPDNSHESAVLDPSHRFAFVLGRDQAMDYQGDTYDVTSGKRVARVSVGSLEPHDQPPPPISAAELRWNAGSITIGQPTGFGMLVDPSHGEVAFLEPSWTLLGDHLLVAQDLTKGDLVLYDLAPGARELSRTRVKNTRADGQAIEIALATVGGHTLAVVYSPLSTLTVDPAGTVSPRRPLPICGA